MYLDIFRSQIDGVPCLIGLTEYVASIPARLYGPPERCEEGWPAEISFDVLKLNHQMYLWLADQMTHDDYERICQEVEHRRGADVSRLRQGGTQAGHSTPQDDGS